MRLKTQYATLDEIPEVLRDYYLDKGDKFVLDAEIPDEDVQKILARERQQRATATKRATELEAQLHQTQEELKTAKAEAPHLPPDATKEAERLKRQYDDRIKAIEAKLQAEEEGRKAAQLELAERSISDTLRTAALDAGVPKGAVEDLIALPRFRKPWRMGDAGEPVPYEGEEARFDPDRPGMPMSAKTYVKEYLKENKHWIPPSNGGGAAGNTAARSSGVIAISREDMHHLENYERVKAEAAKTGASIEIV